MTQQLNVSLTIPIPDDCVLIKKVELEELKESSLQGLYWNMKDLEARTGKKQLWLKENLLLSPKFRSTLDIRSGGFVYYPTSQGQSWSFQASRMADFLEKNFSKIFLN